MERRAIEVYHVAAVVSVVLMVAAVGEAACTAKVTAHIPVNKDTVHWGYYNLSAPFVGSVKSGGVVTVEVATHVSGADYAKMIRGDPGLESIYKWFPGQTTLNKSVPKPPGSGSHIVTGPIEVCGAEPGDVVQVEILKMAPRKNPINQKTYGANVLTNFGYHYVHATHRDGTPFTGNASTVTIYEIIEGKGGRGLYYADPVYQFLVPAITDPSNVTATNTTLPNSYIVPHKKDVGGTNKAVSYPRGFRFALGPNVTGITYTSAALAYRIPLRPHIGIMAVMPANGNKYLTGAPNGTEGASTVPPSRFGGNIDNWRIGAGTTMYYRAELPGAHLVLADTHSAQGDSELSGTAIETSFTVTLRVTLLKEASLPRAVKNLTFPLGETETEYMIHGLAYTDYLDQLPVPSSIATPGSDLNKAFNGAYNQTRNFLMDTFFVREEEAIGIMSTGVDFIVTQVVDSNWGVHGIVKKFIFAKRVLGRKLLEFLGDSSLINNIQYRENLQKRRQESLFSFLWP